MLGVEYVTFKKEETEIVSVYFSPISGMILMQSGGLPVGLVAEGMPPLVAEGMPAWGEESAELADMEEMEVCMCISPSRGLAFGRRRGVDEHMEMSAELPLECLPKESQEHYVSLAFQVDRLQESARVSIAWVGLNPPGPLSPRPFTSHFVWSEHQWRT